MNKAIPLDLLDFELLLKYAQEKHSVKSEPIPTLSDNTERLESCLNTPFQKFGGKYLYPGVLNKAAILFYLINKNHPLINGNKRMVSTLGLFLQKYFLKTVYLFSRAKAKKKRANKCDTKLSLNGGIENLKSVCNAGQNGTKESG